VRLPARATESFTVIGPDFRPVELVDEYLAWLTDCERSPNTVEAYARDLRVLDVLGRARAFLVSGRGDGVGRVCRVGPASGGERRRRRRGSGAVVGADGQPGC